MRKVYLGKFSDYKPISSYEDDMFSYDHELIGGHIAARYDMEKADKTIGLEYYIKDENGKNIMIKDANMLEKILAGIKYVFKPNKARVVGYRSDKISDTLRAGYSLGRKYDEGKWVVDKEYYESRGYIDGKKVDPKTGETRIAKGYFEQKDEGR